VVGSQKQNGTPLRFPGKVLVDDAGGRLFIADSNHNRIVITDLTGKTQQTIGSGAIGRADGGFAQCSFNHPQGMALVGEMLYVADTENHLLRKVDLAADTVTTIAGTGEKASGWPGWDTVGANALLGTGKERRFVGSPKTTPLASPWALWHHGDDLFIAMAGPHQIWKLPLDEREIGPYAGNGREDIADGPLLPRIPYDANYASFAQPSGLASNGERLFVADSEGSTIRSVPLDGSGEVKTLVGLTGTLFDFGDVDGTGRDVRLQHPLGVAWRRGKLYVADTYNNKIKVIDVDARTCRTIAGSGAAGKADAAEGRAATFNEPAGISAAGDKLYVADTNNHAIRLVELAEPYRVTTLEIRGLPPDNVERQ
jgi:sugar lactone lactonase YvrE